MSSAYDRSFGRGFLLLLTVLSLAAFITIIRIFLIDIILAIVFSALFYPLYRWILRHLRGQRGWSSLLCCILLFLGLLIPLFLVTSAVIQQGIELYRDAVPWVTNIMREGTGGMLDRLTGSRLFSLLHLNDVNWQGVVGSAGRNLGGIVVTVINQTSQTTLGAILDVFIIFFSMFYLFRDGPRLLQSVIAVIPLGNRHKDMLIRRFMAISRATVKGTILIGFIQGSLGALTLLLFGVGTWLFWGVVMVILAIIPVVGVFVVLVPAGIIFILTGHVWQGIAVLAINTFVISSVDNVLRPALVGHEAGMHDLIIFFSTLGGISVFGIMGFIIGPLIAALFLAVVQIYSSVFQEQLDSRSSVTPGVQEDGTSASN